MPSITYDYAIVGAGAAGLHLALAMAEDAWFGNKSILVIDKQLKDQNDKTWCFWEEGSGKWDKLIHKSWPVAQFITQAGALNLKLSPFKYKMLHALDFYNYARQRLLSQSNINWITSDVKNITQDKNGYAEIHSDGEIYVALHVFDSRIDPGYDQNRDRYVRIYQHFKGWYVRTKSPSFDPTAFIMMDYRLKWQDQTSFTYVLPTSSHEALVEYTFFTPEMVDEHVYDEMIKKYLHALLKIDDYEIRSVEKGVIPMTSYPFHRSSLPGITKIGTAGSWVKPSTGYSFKNGEQMARKIVQNIKAQQDPAQGLLNKKFRMYDSIFLNVLAHQNHLGEQLFTNMYHRNPIQKIFRFLDESSTIKEDFDIIRSFPPVPFLKAVWRLAMRI